MTDKTNDFDIAKATFEGLENLEKDRQRRILRWVAESLGINLEVRNADTSGSLSEPLIFGKDDRSPPGSSPSIGAKSIDIKSFVDSKKPKSDVQFAAVVAYYYRFEAPEDQRQESITPKVLQEAARLAGRKRLERPHTTINNAKNLGYLDSTTRGTFRINTVGENLVAMTLPGLQGDSQKPPARRQGAQKRAARKK